MWAKDDYQEHMLGYLGGVRAEIERLKHTNLQHYDLSELRSDLDKASELLWWLIRSSDGDWERLRYPLENCCDDLLRVLQHEPNAKALKRAGVSFRPISTLKYASVTVVQREPEINSSKSC